MATPLRKKQEELTQLCNTTICPEAADLALWLTYLPLVGRVGDIELTLPAQTLADVSREENTDAAFATLTRLCETLEEQNEVLRDTATGLLRYIPQDAEIIHSVQQLLTALQEYLAEQEDNAAAADFLTRCLNRRPVSAPKGADTDTPECICDLFRKLAPQAKTVYDPCCGTGRLTAAVAQNTTNAVYGQDILSTVQPYFFIRNLLAGNTYARFFRGNSVTHPLSFSDTELQHFDLVVSQPPFGYNAEGTDVLGNDPYHRFDRGLPRRNSGDWLHICNCLAHAEPTHGTVMTLATRATLFRVDISTEIRRRLVEENLLDAVIALPAGVIPGPAVATALLIFKYNRSRKGVRFIDATGLGVKRRNTVEIDDDFDTIIDAYRSDSEDKGFARTVSAEEIAAHGHHWDVGHYITAVTEEELEKSPPEELLFIVKNLQRRIADSQAQLAELLKKL